MIKSRNEIFSFFVSKNALSLYISVLMIGSSFFYTLYLSDPLTNSELIMAFNLVMSLPFAFAGIFGYFEGVFCFVIAIVIEVLLLTLVLRNIIPWWKFNRLKK